MARPVGLGGRGWRWARRNKMLALTVASLTLTFLLGTPALLGLWLRARADQALAMTERNRARVERDRAERSRDRAIAAVQVLIGTESDDTFSEEMRPYLKKITDAGLRESLALVRELEGDPRAEIEVIRAHVGLAQLHDAAGEPVLALASLRKATALAERLADRDPRSIQSRAMLATVLHRASTLLPDTGERRSALRRSTDILQVLLAENPDGDRRSWHRLVAINHYNDGHSLFGLGRFPEAIAAFRAARVAYNELLADSAPEPDDRFLAARNLLFLCRAHGERFDDAMEAGHEALAVFQKLVAEHADSFEYAYQLYLAQSEIGMKGAGAANWELAIRSFESARHALKVQAATWGKLVSRMARIQEALVETDYNLFFAYDSDPVQFAGPMREILRELFDVCEKLSVLQAPPGICASRTPRAA